MSKSPRERTSPTKPGRVQDERPLIPVKYQHAAAVAAIFLSLIIFFNPIVFGGKTFLSVDTIASHSFDTFVKDAKNQGIFPLWNPYIFCGMPAYASLTVGGDRFFDISGIILNKAVQLIGYLFVDQNTGWVLSFYLIFAVGMYLFVFDKLRNKFAALVAALGATFSMYIIIWVMEGHNTKIAVMAMFPYIMLVIERLRGRFSLWLSLALILLLHFSFLPSHIQMIFYTYLAIGVYLLFFLLRSVLKKKGRPDETMDKEEGGWKGVVRAGVILAVASAVAFSMDADKYLSVLEYNPYSIRGSNPIIPAVQTGEVKTVGGGLDYNYATDWSLGPGEMMTFIIPSWYGFGLQTYTGPLSNNREMRMNTYFGPQPFTHAPQYMGIVVLVLAVIGFWLNRRNAFIQYMAIMIVLSLLIAFGKEFPIVYDLMYKYFPGFNKFRVPSMILVLVQIFVPVLAAYGINSLLSRRGKALSQEEEKKWKYVMAGLGGLFILSLVARGIFRSIYEGLLPPQSVTAILSRQYGPMPPNVANELYSYIFSNVINDFSIALALLVSLGAFYLYRKETIRLTMLGVLIVAAVIADLWRIDYRPMDPQDRRQQAQVFSAPPYVGFLQKDSTLFRVLEFDNGQPPYNNTLAYWRIQSAYGYHGAKMRAYQDMVDVVGLNNPLLYQLMNVKYIITNRPDTSAGLSLVFNGPTMRVYLFNAALPRAFFVNRYEVKTGLEILNNISNLSFDPRDVAFFMEDPKIDIRPAHPAARAEMKKYDIHNLEIKTTTDGNNLLFLSEMYYPEGWKAFVDGRETKIYRVNYLFRGVVVPGGIHTIEMKFEPRGFYLGKNLSLAANILVIGSLGVVGFRSWRKKKQSVNL